MKLKLINKIDEAKGTKSFFWESENPVLWKPGQYYYYTLPTLKYGDSRGPTRHFTISSSPTEGRILRLTTRIRKESGYKRTLDELKIGTIIEGEGPTGTFILDENESNKQHVFLAGGIGITPFRVFAKYNIDKNLKVSMHLIYSNSIPEEISFQDELEKWSQEYPFFKISLIISKPEESKTKWSGLEGRIDDSVISSLTKDYPKDKTNFWVVGPPPFVNAMEENLEKIKIPSSNVITEKFTGY